MTIEVEIGEATATETDETEAAKREELVIPSDIHEVLKMTKDELKDYAFTRFGIKLDLTKKIKNLQLDVVMLIKKKLGKLKEAENTGKTEKKKTNEDGAPKYLLHTGNGRILDYTEILAARPDCVPCDENGKRL